LEFEKVYWPYLLINKKRYAGLYWTRVEQYDKMDTKGIETVRRDNCRLVQTVISATTGQVVVAINSLTEELKLLSKDQTRLTVCVDDMKRHQEHCINRSLTARLNYTKQSCKS
jgi:hypothetical protein